MTFRMPHGLGIAISQLQTGGAIWKVLISPMVLYSNSYTSATLHYFRPGSLPCPLTTIQRQQNTVPRVYVDRNLEWILPSFTAMCASWPRPFFLLGLWDRQR